jgi:hypothetical protein
LDRAASRHWYPLFEKMVELDVPAMIAKVGSQMLA